MVFVIGFSTSSILVTMFAPIFPAFLTSGLLPTMFVTFPIFEPAAPSTFPPPSVASSRAWDFK